MDFSLVTKGIDVYLDARIKGWYLIKRKKEIR